MKKLVFILFLLLFPFAHGATLSGGISQNVDSGFMGSWLVSGELIGEPIKGFQVRTNQFWNLGKINNVMVLENRLTGARGEIKIDKAFTGKKSYLKFTNTCKNGDLKISTDHRAENSFRLEYIPAVPSRNLRKTPSYY